MGLATILILYIGLAADFFLHMGLATVLLSHIRLVTNSFPTHGPESIIHSLYFFFSKIGLATDFIYIQA